MSVYNTELMSADDAVVAEDDNGAAPSVTAMDLDQLPDNMPAEADNDRARQAPSIMHRACQHTHPANIARLLMDAGDPPGWW